MQVVCQNALTKTIASAMPTGRQHPAQPHATPMSFAASRSVETSASGFFCPASSCCLAAVDPDHRDLLLQTGLDIVVVAGRDVYPPLLAADPALALGEVRRIGLVGAHLLRGYDQVEVQRDVSPGLAQQLVVDVRDQPDLVLLGDLRQHRVGLLERQPALDRVGQKARARGLQRPAQMLGDLDRRAPQNLGV